MLNFKRWSSIICKELMIKINLKSNEYKLFSIYFKNDKKNTKNCLVPTLPKRITMTVLGMIYLLIKDVALIEHKKISQLKIVDRYTRKLAEVLKENENVENFLLNNDIYDKTGNKSNFSGYENVKEEVPSDVKYDNNDINNEDELNEHYPQVNYDIIKRLVYAENEKYYFNEKNKEEIRNAEKKYKNPLNEEKHDKDDYIIFDDGNPEINFFTNKDNMKIARYAWYVPNAKAHIFGLHGITSHLRNEYLNYYGRPKWADKNRNTNEGDIQNEDENTEGNSCKSCDTSELKKSRRSANDAPKNSAEHSVMSNTKNEKNFHSESSISEMNFKTSIDDEKVLIIDESDNNANVDRNLYYCSYCGLTDYCNCGERTLSYENSWIQKFNENNFSFFGIDNQSHGLSDGYKDERCFVDKFDDFVLDAVQGLEIFIKELKEKNDVKPIIIMGTSMGGCIALKMFEYIHKLKKEWKTQIKGLVLVSPMISVDRQKKKFSNRMLISLGNLLKKLYPLLKIDVKESNAKYDWIKYDSEIDPFQYCDGVKVGIASECVTGADNCLKDDILKYIDKSDVDIMILQSKYDVSVDPTGTVNFMKKMIDIYNDKNDKKSNNKNINGTENKKNVESTNLKESNKNDENKKVSVQNVHESNSIELLDGDNEPCKHLEDYTVLRGNELEDDKRLWNSCNHGYYKNFKKKIKSKKNNKNESDKEEDTFKHLSAHILNYGSHCLACEPQSEETLNILMNWLNSVNP
ncbi:alpha/beta hydrolase, putative [Plasmodium sp. DRC-Itaito]|uniref:Alpha/beta hydrolase, putative n=1 Tax=Plasmodium gaboni TaxID=647221 RepID=A0ABY0KW93_9APIC|nr:alpha/beta hydrolase, putative [Plasmodium gaboni]SOV22741.1 alpha/beta hydrolase, putative [Plasmodium sp. DRC-Itaito]